MNVELNDIRLTELNNKCIMFISRFLRVLKAHDGTELCLHDSDIVQEVYRLGSGTSDTELKRLFALIKKEIKEHY